MRPLFVLASLVLLSSAAVAPAESQCEPQRPQSVQPLAVCPDPVYTVWITPNAADGDTAAAAHLPAGRFISFTITNTGNANADYDISCGGTGIIACTGTDYSMIGLSPGASWVVGAGYTVSGSGSGVLTLTVVVHQTLQGFSGSIVLLDRPFLLDPSVHNGDHRNSALCAINCFDATVAYSTRAYWSLDAPRALTLRYSSGSAQGRHLIQVNARQIAGYGGGIADSVSLRLRRPDGSYVTFTNGFTEVFFHSDTGTR